MAVVVQCYNCSNILELDDGFRGGVCRCSQCGSLLQVPKGSSSDMRKARPAAPGAQISTVQRPSDPTADPGLSRGQFDPRSPTRPASPGDSGVGARAIAAGRSAGLSTARLPTVKERVVIKKNRTMLYAVIALMALIGVGVLVGLAVLIMKSTGQSTVQVPPTGDNPTEPPQPVGTSLTPGPGAKPAVTGPVFLDSIPLVGPQIVFSIDGSNANTDSFDYVRKGVERAIEAMTPDQRFVIAVWKDSDLKLFPAQGWASKATFANVQTDFDNVGAYGSSDAAECMVKSLQLKGDQTIFVTAKFSLPPDIAQPVLAVRTNGQRIDAIKISSEDVDSPLGTVVKATTGKFVSKMDISTLENIVSREP